MGSVDSNRYWVKVDESAENDAHAFAIDMIGYGKRVLELGPAAGHVTRSLARRGCDVVGIEFDPEAAAGLEGVAECIVGDLNDPSVISKAAEVGGFDVALAGDVLEHLADPLPTLRACREVLVPGGYVVISLPNVAHADVALSLLQGQFPYKDCGLLDRTHLRFFTFGSIAQLLEHAGLLAIEIRRVIRPIFETELGLDPAAFTQCVVESVLGHDEAETYQFVVRAVPHNGDLAVSRLASSAIEANDRWRREHSARLAAEAELVIMRNAAESARRAERSQKAEVERWRHSATANQRRIERLMSSRTMRYTAPMRAVYKRFRSTAR